jgi:hypothetical protein
MPKPLPARARRIAAVALLLLVPLGCGGDDDDGGRAGGAGDGNVPAGAPRGTSRDSEGSARDSGADVAPEGAGSALGPAGVKLPPPAFRFEDATAESGLGGEINHSGRGGVKEFLVEAVGPGACWIDFDNDGRLDLYVPDGDEFLNYRLAYEDDPQKPGAKRAVLREKDPRPQPFRDRLYRNLGGGKFEDVTVKAGVGDERWSFGALAWDHDGDGWTDIFLANYGKCRLWHNNGNGTFTDRAEELGLAGSPDEWATNATCGDYDGDGRLDLYVGRYSDVAHEVESQRARKKRPEDTPVEDIRGRGCKWRGIQAYCGPVGLKGQHDSLYRQRPDGTFEDVSAASGVRAKNPKYAFQCFFFDYDGDGLLDVFVANDSEENFLWKQQRDASGEIRFTDVAEIVGVKYGSANLPQASMGAAVADMNQDGIFDLFVTNFSHDWNNIYLGARYAGGVSYKDRGLQVMGEAVFYDLAWGCGWYDFDDDGDLDLLVANGHVYKEIDLFEKTGTAYDQHPAVFECLDPKGYTVEAKTVPPKYREVGGKMKEKRLPKGTTYEDLFAGKGLEIKKCSRGATFGDYDNDGDVDVFLGRLNDAPTLLRNDLAPGEGRGWVKLALRMPGGNREGIGATVKVTSKTTVDRVGTKESQDLSQWFCVYRGSSFLGTDDARLHVGVGDAKTVDVTVTWPGPAKETTEYKGLAVRAFHVLLKDGKVEAGALPR